MFTLHYDDHKSIYAILPNEYDIVYNSKGKYINLSCSFDIESTSIINNDLKVGLMYAWGLGINGKVVIGRTWEDFLDSLKIISDYFKLKSKKIKLIIYVHNLSFEFQFFRKLMKWKKVFAFKERQVIYCLNDLNIEFRCSYLLSNNNLDNLGENLIKYKVNKLVGYLDYSKIRHSNTPLTNKEIQYLINDNLVVMAYIQELTENNDNNICNLPLTSTGFVRKYLKNKCYENPKRYNELIRKLRLNMDSYNLLKRCFQGGFTHANPYNLGKICKNVDSFDIVSSYPFVLLSEKYPMSEPIPYIFKNENDFFNKIKNDELFICDIKFYGIKSKNKSDYYISSSKCYLQVDTIVFNGRVESANELGLSLTSIDLKIIINNYDFDYFEKYNLSKSRVLYYPWGVFCTAYARKILWEIITKIDKISHNDYIYLDTDSIKLMNSYKYEKIKSKIQEKKLRDLNPEEWAKWKNKNCDSNICGKCIFNNVACYSWVNHKDLYSDKFLDQE